MKKIVSVLVLSLLAGQASAQITNHSIEKNLEQCIALAQHSMSNEEIIATEHVHHRQRVAIGIGAGIYYFYNAQNNTTNTTNLNDID